jgi:lipopolysaccharide/colanic/teichoic acid biosynthesis glycosyltransferase
MKNIDHCMKGVQTMWSKRALDLIGSTIGLILLSPFFLIVMILVKMDSKGPAFFTQIRYTKDRKPFSIYKFRTMTHLPAKAQNALATANDQEEKVTKLGDVLRRYKINEFPQLINVFLGDMSLVGPRPMMLWEIDLLAANKEDADRLFEVKSGMTDYASIYFYNEFEYLNKGADSPRYYSEVIMPFKMKLKVWYIDELEKYGVLLDIKIILLTILRLFGMRMNRADLQKIKLSNQGK